MDISKRTIDGVLVVEAFGSLGRASAGRFYDELVAAVGDGGQDLVLDLSGLSQMGRSGTRAVVVAAKLLRTARKRMRICGAGPEVVGVLQAVGVSHLLAFDETLDASLTALAAKPRRPRAVTAAPAAQRAPERAPAADFEDFVGMLRVEYARFLIDQKSGPVDRIAATCGYESLDAMRRDFLRQLGVLPSEYAARAAWRRDRVEAATGT